MSQTKLELSMGLFEPKLMQLVEELKIRRDIESKKDERFDSLMAQKYESQRAFDESISSMKQQVQQSEEKLQAAEKKLAAALACQSAGCETSDGGVWSRLMGDAELTELKAALRGLEQEKCSLLRQLSSAEEQLRLQSATRDTAGAQVAHLSKGIARAQAALEALAGRVDQADQMATIAAKQTQGYKDLLQRTRATLNSVTAQRDELWAANLQARAAKAGANLEGQRRAAATREQQGASGDVLKVIAELRERLASLEKESEEKSALLLQAQSTAARMSKEEEYERELLSLKDQLKKMEKVSSENKNTADLLSAELAKVCQEREDGKKSLAEAEENVKKLQKQLDSSVTDVTQLANANDKLTKENESLTAKVTSLEAEQESLAAKVKGAEMANAASAELELELDRQKGVLEKREQEWRVEREQLMEKMRQMKSDGNVAKITFTAGDVGAQQQNNTPVNHQSKATPPQQQPVKDKPQSKVTPWAINRRAPPVREGVPSSAHDEPSDRNTVVQRTNVEGASEHRLMTSGEAKSFECALPKVRQNPATAHSQASTTAPYFLASMMNPKLPLGPPLSVSVSARTDDGERASDNLSAPGVADNAKRSAADAWTENLLQAINKRGRFA